jgi:hypothetical protein
MSRSNRHTTPRLTCVLALATAVFAACPASSSDAPAHRGPNTDPSAKLDGGQSPALSAVERLSLSDRLAAYGNRAGDPVALVQAAKIRKGLSGTTQGKASGGAEFDALLARAAALAPGNSAVQALIADARSYRSRDLPLVSAGLSVLNKIIGSRAADRADLAFRGETPAIVYVKGPEQANLDLYVYDEYNNLICSDEDSGDEAQCRWRPRWTGTFLVDVRNQNDQEVAYVLTANYVEGQAATP